MGEEVPDWRMMWGAKVATNTDMPDDILYDAIHLSREALDQCQNFETEGEHHVGHGALEHPGCCIAVSWFEPAAVPHVLYSTGLACAEKIKAAFDAKWLPYWHVIIGRNFGSFVTHETKMFIYFYLGERAVMLFKAG